MRSTGRSGTAWSDPGAFRRLPESFVMGGAAPAHPVVSRRTAASEPISSATGNIIEDGSRQRMNSPRSLRVTKAANDFPGTFVRQRQKRGRINPAFDRGIWAWPATLFRESLLPGGGNPVLGPLPAPAPSPHRFAEVRVRLRPAIPLSWMKPLLSSVMLLAGVFQCACSTTGRSRPPLQVFYEQAKKRCQTADTLSNIDLAGLQFTEAMSSNAMKGPKWDESSIIVMDAEGSTTGAVQVIVHPRVSGSYLDPQEPSEEFLREQVRATGEALKRHRYTGVFRVQNPASN